MASNPSHETQNSLWIKTRGKISGSTPASSSRDLLISKIEKVTLKTRKAACYIASSVTDICIYIYTYMWCVSLKVWGSYHSYWCWSIAFLLIYCDHWNLRLAFMRTQTLLSHKVSMWKNLVSSRLRYWTVLLGRIEFTLLQRTKV